MPPPRDETPPKRFPLRLARVQGGSDVGAAGAALQRPQRLVREAAADATRRAAPTGLGLDSAAVRARMVQRLRAAGIDDERVLAAFAQVERHRFFDSALVNQAYEDTSLPIGLGQTISKPSVVAHMLQALLQGRQRPGRLPLGQVLEIGTGCGYQAALLACVADRVVSIERLAPLAERARGHLAAVGANQVEVWHGDGRLGAPQRAPFDGVLSAAGGDDLPTAWLEQLAMGGRCVAPATGTRPGVQDLVVVDRGPGGFVRRVVGEVYFVALKSGAE